MSESQWSGRGPDEESRSQPIEEPLASRPQLVVGIGASAGGLDALVRFFDNLRPDTGMAFVVVQHLSPDFKSLMDELLARHTALPIHLVEHGMPVEADHVYLIPSKKEMIISGERLLLSERDRQQELTLPIDVFFRSLAQDCGPRAAAIVLSGGGSDGSRGVREVHENGGLVIVQDPATAQFDGMPKAARDVGVAELMLAPEAMPQALLDHAEGKSAPLDAAEEQPAGIHAVYRMLQEQFGIDFTHYKPSTVTRRIERRLALARSQDIEEYVARLRSEREELDSLYRDLLIASRTSSATGRRSSCSSSGSCPSCGPASRATRRCGCGSRAARQAKRRTRSRSWPTISWSGSGRAR